MTDAPWPAEPLADLGTWYGGGTPSRARPDLWIDGAVPWLSPKDMGWSVLSDTADHITQAAVEQSAARWVPSGSVAVVVRSGILERTVPIALVPFATTLNQDMKAISPRSDVDARWIAWGLRAREQDILRTCRKAGTTVASLETVRLRELRLPVPPLEEQRRIVDILEDHLSRLDAADDYATAAGRRAALLSTAALRCQRSLTEAPNVPLRDVLASGLSNGRSVPTQIGGFPVLRLTALGQHKVQLQHRKGGMWSLAEARPFLVERGDYLVSRGNGSLKLVGRGAPVVDEPDPVAYPDTLIRVRVDPTRLDLAFLHLIWNSAGVRQQIEGVARTTAGIYKINQKHLESTFLPLPTLQEQRSVVGNVSRVADAAERLSVEALAAAGKAQRLRRALLAAAFAGRLTGRRSDLDRAEEDANAAPQPCAGAVSHPDVIMAGP